MADPGSLRGKSHLREAPPPPEVVRSPDWPYDVERPGRGEVRACPRCGCVAVFNCWHDDEGSISTVVMNAARAAHLRRTSGLYSPMTFECSRCGYDGPFEAGMVVATGGDWLCAACAGATSVQVAAARRQVASASQEDRTTTSATGGAEPDSPMHGKRMPGESTP